MCLGMYAMGMLQTDGACAIVHMSKGWCRTTACAHRSFPLLEAHGAREKFQSPALSRRCGSRGGDFNHAAGSGLGDADAKVLLLGILETGAPPTQHLTCR
jgi:hypothetical protein